MKLDDVRDVLAGVEKRASLRASARIKNGLILPEAEADFVALAKAVLLLSSIVADTKKKGKK